MPAFGDDVFQAMKGLTEKFEWEIENGGYTGAVQHKTWRLIARMLELSIILNETHDDPPTAKYMEELKTLLIKVEKRIKSPIRIAR